MFFLSHLELNAQEGLPIYFKFSKVLNENSLLPSNSVSQMAIRDSILWIGTSKGLAKSTNSGRGWTNFRDKPEFANYGIYALDVVKDTIWTATGYLKEKENNKIQTGSGYTFSTDGGLTWSYISQTLDQRGDSIEIYGINTIRILPVIVPEQNVTFDLSLARGKVWIASWASGLRYSTNNGQKWNRIILPPDNLSSIKPTDTINFYYDPRKNNNFLAFSVLAIDNDTIWCGTAGGINKSTDGGISWKKFNRQNQDFPILGNWVITTKQQRYNNINRIWTTNWKAEDQREEFGVSYTENGGQTWTNLLRGVKAYDFAFKDSIVYIATEIGIYRTADLGLSFSRSNVIMDSETRQIITTTSVFSVGVQNDTVFIGTGDGMAMSLDNAENPFGAKWKILRRFERVGNSKNTYAYPNPFAPDDGYTRIHYSTQGRDALVSIDIFDFGMNRVRTVIRNASRSGKNEHDEIWDGRDDTGRFAANGVYFYQVRIDDDEPTWGKIMVLK